MDAKELVLKSLEQSQGYLDRVLDGLTQEEFAWCPSNECNNIAFILWHTARVEEFFVNRVIQLGDLFCLLDRGGAPGLAGAEDGSPQGLYQRRQGEDASFPQLHRS